MLSIPDRSWSSDCKSIAVTPSLLALWCQREILLLTFINQHLLSLLFRWHCYGSEKYFFSAEMCEVCEMEDNDSFLQTGLRWQADSSK